MNTQAIQKKLDKYMETATPEQIVKEFEDLGVEFIELPTVTIEKYSTKELYSIVSFIKKEIEKRRQEEFEQLDSPENKKKYWEENESEDMTWEEFDERFDMCYTCHCYVDEPCICYAR